MPGKNEIELILSAQSQRFEAAMKRAISGLGKMGGSARKTGLKFTFLTGMVQGFSQELTRAMINVAKTVPRAMANFSKTVVKTNEDIENLRLRLKYITGSAKEAERMFRFFEETAGDVGFTIEDIATASARLAAVGLDTEKWVNPMMDVAAVVKEDLSVIADQVTRVASAGLGAADIFRERGIADMITQHFKMTREAFMKLPPAQQVDKMWEAFSGEKFAGAAQEAAETYSGILSMLSDKWWKFKKLVGEAGFFESFKNLVKKINDTLSRLFESGKMKEIADRVGGMMGRIINSLSEKGEQFIKDLPALIQKWQENIKEYVEKVKGFIDEIKVDFRAAKQVFEDFKGWIKDISGTLGTMFANLEDWIDGTIDKMRSWYEKHKEYVDAALDNLSAAGGIGPVTYGGTELPAEIPAEKSGPQKSPGGFGKKVTQGYTPYLKKYEFDADRETFEEYLERIAEYTAEKPKMTQEVNIIVNGEGASVTTAGPQPSYAK